MEVLTSRSTYTSEGLPSDESKSTCCKRDKPRRDSGFKNFYICRKRSNSVDQPAGNPFSQNLPNANGFSQTLTAGNSFIQAPGSGAGKLSCPSAGSGAVRQPKLSAPAAVSCSSGVTAVRIPRDRLENCSCIVEEETAAVGNGIVSNTAVGNPLDVNRSPPINGGEGLDVSSRLSIDVYPSPESPSIFNPYLKEYSVSLEYSPNLSVSPENTNKSSIEDTPSVSTEQNPTLSPKYIPNESPEDSPNVSLAPDGTQPCMFGGFISGRAEDPAWSPAEKELHQVLQTTRPRILPLPGYSDGEKPPKHLACRAMDLCSDEGLYVGDRVAATDLTYLARVGITHVLNAAQGSRNCTVDTSANFYKKAGIKYLGFPLLDTPGADISQHFEEGADFIEQCLEGGGKVLVNCFMGISRSATLAAAFLMLRRGHTATAALTSLRQRRHVFPNDGFLSALVKLEAKINKAVR